MLTLSVQYLHAEVSLYPASMKQLVFMRHRRDGLPFDNAFIEAIRNAYLPG